MTEGATDTQAETDAARGDRERVERAVRKLQAGLDVEGSFDFLFRRFSPALLRQLVSWGAAAEEARDLNQEIFQRIYRDVGRFRGGDPLFNSWVAWIWQIARTSWLRSLRARRAQKRPGGQQPLESVDEERAAEIARPPSQLDDVLERELEGRVRRAIEELPEQELKCVILHYFQGLRTREVAVVLRIAQGTVKAHLSHARDKLKTKLGSRLEIEGDFDRAGGMEPGTGEMRV
jgi:RNA polymerase sigma-70 factor (ECF subfamily)